MPANYSSKRLRDAKSFSRWAALPDAQFASMRISRSDLEALQKRIAGTVVVKGDDGYDEARQVFNPLFNSYPDVIVYCRTEADAVAALLTAQMFGLPFCVRSSGHSTAGYSTGDGLLIDVSSLNQVHIDPGNLLATVGCGCDFGALYAALELYGLHVPAGECPDVAVGGFVQGGGYGFTSVTHGMNCDNVVSFRVLLASGDIVQADATTNADLFWALRGGTGGNFGILLSVTYALRPLGQVTGWALAWPLTSEPAIAEAVAAMLCLQQSYMRNSICGPEMNIQVSLCFQNHLDTDKPPPPSGTPLEPYLMIRGLWLGEATALPDLLKPLTDLPGRIRQWVLTDRFAVLNDKLLNYPQEMPVLEAMPFEDKSTRYISRDLDAGEWTSLLGLFARAPNNMAYGYGEFYGGAIAAVPRLATAFVHRTAVLNMVMDVFWLENADRKTCEEFLRNWNRTLEPLSNGEAYQNYASPYETDFAARYWAEAYPALRVIKTKYDPANAFRFPQQIAPIDGERPVIDPDIPPAVIEAIQQEVSVLVPARHG